MGRLIMLIFAALWLVHAALAQHPSRVVQPPALTDSGDRLTAKDLQAWSQHFLLPRLKEREIAGATVSVVRDGALLFEGGYGYADVGRRVKMDPRQTVVGVASVSKLFAWTAVMQQVERGKIDLDADINTYLDYRIPDAFGRPITMRHLMTHSAGFEEMWPRLLKANEPSKSLAEFMRTTTPPTRVRAPGEMVAYSNYSSGLGGYIVERVTGEPFAVYVEKHIFRPLGMTSSTFRDPQPPALLARLTKSYNLASEKPADPIRFQPSPHPGGSLITTADDMSRFMIAYLEGGASQGQSLLQPASIAEMFTPTRSPIAGASLGFWRLDTNGREMVGHTGDDDIGGHAGMMLLPREKVGLFIEINSHGRSPSAVPAAMQLRHDFIRAFMDRYFPAPAKPPLPTLSTAKAHGAIIAGEYAMTRRGEGDFFVARDALVNFLALKLAVTQYDDGTIETAPFMSHEEKPRRWREVAPFVWQQVDGEGRLIATMDKGRVETLRITDRPYWYYDPIPAYRAYGWNIPALGAAAIALLVLAIGWPIFAWLRRRKAEEVGLQERKLAILARASGLVALFYLTGWMAVVAIDVAGMTNGEIWIRILQGVGLVIAAGTLVAAWSVFLAIRNHRGAGIILSRAINAAALLMVSWFSVAFDLISAKLIY